MTRILPIIALCFAALTACAEDLPQSRKLLAYCGIGNGATTAENPRAINPGPVPGHDWAAFWKSQQPLVDQGLKRWILWMPFGRDDEPADSPYRDWFQQKVFRPQPYREGDKFRVGGSNLRVDQYSSAKASGKYAKLCDTFVPATKAFVESDKEREVICYVGMIVGAPEWDANYESVESLTKRLDAELAVYLDAGCSIAFDATGMLSKDHWFYGYLQTLKTKTRVYIEAWPHQVAPHLASENCIGTTSELINYSPSSIGTHYLDPAKITGERQAWLVVYPPGTVGEPKFAAWYRKVIPAMLADPNIDSVACYLGRFVAEGGRLEELRAVETDWRGMLP